MSNAYNISTFRYVFTLELTVGHRRIFMGILEMLRVSRIILNLTSIENDVEYGSQTLIEVLTCCWWDLELEFEIIMVAGFCTSFQITVYSRPALVFKMGVLVNTVRGYSLYTSKFPQIRKLIPCFVEIDLSVFFFNQIKLKFNIAKALSNDDCDTGQLEWIFRVGLSSCPWYLYSEFSTNRQKRNTFKLPNLVN